MRLKTLSLVLVTISLAFIIVGCKGQPVEPEIQVCIPELVFDANGSADFANSTVFCTSDMNPDDPAKQKHVPFVTYMLQKPIMAQVDEYTLKLKWAEELRAWGKTHCK